jgi:phage terminase small subunit
MKAKRPPTYLSPAAKQVWTELIREYNITDAAGLRTLEGGIPSYDRAELIRRKIAEQGLTIVDRFGIEKANPLLAAERDARTQWLATLKQLNFDLEPLRDRPGRPPGR